MCDVIVVLHTIFNTKHSKILFFQFSTKPKRDRGKFMRTKFQNTGVYRLIDLCGLKIQRIKCVWQGERNNINQCVHRYECRIAVLPQVREIVYNVQVCEEVRD